MSAKESDLVKWMLKDRSAAIKDLPVSPRPISSGITRIPTSSSLSKFWNEDDNEWSVFDQYDEPEIDEEGEWDEEVDELDEDEDEDRPTPPVVPPPLFRGLSIESIYSVWTSCTSLNLNSIFEEDKSDQEPPSKRLKHVSSDSSESNKEDSEKAQGNKDCIVLKHFVNCICLRL
jgi:hypothetical protein